MSCFTSLRIIGKVALAVLTLAGCTPSFKLETEQVRHVSVSGESGRESSGPSSLGSGESTPRFVCNDSGTRGLSEKLMRRLSKSELVNTLTDLLGREVIGDAQIQIQLSLLNDDKLNQNVIDIPDAFSPTHAAALLKIVGRAADLAFASPAIRDSVFGACSGQATVSEVCANDFIRSFGQRALRRVVTSTESAELLSTYQKMTGAEGLKRVLMRILMNPALAFHQEFGNSIVGQRVRLTDYEIASRLSYRLTGSAPDTALLEDASSGALQDLNNVRTHARRLIESGKAQERVKEFFRFYLQTDKIVDPNEFVARSHSLSSSQLADEYRTEIDEFIQNVVWKKKGSYKELLTSREVFPRSDRMARILETMRMTSAEPSVTTAAHAGILLRPGMLAASTVATNTFHRSLFIRKRILCESFGLPDPTLVAEQQSSVGDLSHLSNRDRLARLTEPRQCQACHSRINPIGFVLEGYDSLGMVRTLESVFDNSGNLKETHVVITKVDDVALPNAGPVEDAIGLNAKIAEGMAARSCFAQTVFEFQRTRVFTDDDLCALGEVEKVAQNGSVQDVFLLSVANEDIFWRNKGE